MQWNSEMNVGCCHDQSGSNLRDSVQQEHCGCSLGVLVPDSRSEEAPDEIKARGLPWWCGAHAASASASVVGGSVPTLVVCTSACVLKRVSKCFGTSRCSAQTLILTPRISAGARTLAATSCERSCRHKFSDSAGTAAHITVCISLSSGRWQIPTETMSFETATCLMMHGQNEKLLRLPKQSADTRIRDRPRRRPAIRTNSSVYERILGVYHIV